MIAAHSVNAALRRIGKLALWKDFFERTVIAEAWRDVSPFHDERFVRRAASYISADGHCPKSAAMIALPSRENPVAILLAAFHVKLARELYDGFGGFRAAGSEVDTAAVSKIRWSHREKARSKFFRRSSVKLRGVRESDLRRLLGHGPADFSDTVTDADNGGLPRGIEKSARVSSDDPAALPTNGNGIGLLEIAGEKSATRRHEMPRKEL